MMRFLRWFCAAMFLEEIEGDLFELYQEEVETYGKKKASRRFLWIALKYINPYFFGRRTFSLNLEYHLTMLRHYFKIAFRHLWRQRTYSMINIFGLAVGLACCITVLFYVLDEVGYDAYHENADHLYRISNRVVTLSGGDEQYVAAAPILWGPALKNDYPEVEGFARFVNEVNSDNPWRVTVDDQTFAESDILFC